jgi:hypothetical protein
MFKIQEIHLKDYLPKVIKKYGHAYLHGDGNIYIDKATDQNGNPIQATHQASYIAKTFSAIENESARYVVKFTSVDQIPGSVDEMEKLFMSTKQRELREATLTNSANDFQSIEEDPKPEKKKGGRPKSEKEETE